MAKDTRFSGAERAYVCMLSCLDLWLWLIAGEASGGRGGPRLLLSLLTNSTQRQLAVVMCFCLPSIALGSCPPPPSFNHEPRHQVSTGIILSPPGSRDDTRRSRNKPGAL